MEVRITAGNDRPEILNNSPNMQELSRWSKFTIGSEDKYFSEYFGLEELNRLMLGRSIIVSAPVGSGKTQAFIKTAIKYDDDVVILTNRSSSCLQIKRDVLKELGVDVRGWSETAIDRAKTNQISVMTYQALSKYENYQKFRKGTVLIMDEVQYLLNDATFSNIPMQIYDIIRCNLDNTKRVYVSATMEEVAPVIYDIERLDGKKLIPSPQFNFLHSRIDHLYFMIGSWNNLTFRFYEYSDLEKLADTLNQSASENIKSAVFLRSKARGSLLKEKLNDSQFVYSSEEEQEELNDIVLNERFSSDCLIATKVMENGVSIHDDNIGIIVIEEIDPVSFVQFLGRVRVKRRNPRPLVVMIPDYTASELKVVSRQCYETLNVIHRVMESPEVCMKYYERYAPFVYYSDNGPRANMLAQTKISLFKKHIDTLIEDNEPHAHIRFILRLLGLPETIEDCQFLNYDDISVFKDGVKAAYQKFADSPMLKENRDILAKELIQVVKKTKCYKKKITGSQLQLDTINDILANAGITADICSLGEAFSLRERSM